MSLQTPHLTQLYLISFDESSRGPELRALDGGAGIDLNGPVDSNGGTWGGKRERAGRKPGPNVRVSLSIPREVWAELEALARQRETTPEQLSVAWLLEMTTRPPRSEK